MPFSLRLDPKTESRIRRLARETGRSRSAVVREAMEQYGVHKAAEASDDGPPDLARRLGPFIGIVATGGADLSVDTHAKYRARLKASRGRRTR